MSAGSQRFSRRLRLLKAAEFQHVFRGPCRAGDATIMFLARPNTLAHPRLGLAIGRKTAPGAVVRNRLKRAVRESFRQQQGMLGAVDVVVWVRKSFKTATHTELRNTLAAGWRELAAKCAGS